MYIWYDSAEHDRYLNGPSIEFMGKSDIWNGLWRLNGAEMEGWRKTFSSEGNFNTKSSFNIVVKIKARIQMIRARMEVEEVETLSKLDYCFHQIIR